MRSVAMRLPNLVHIVCHNVLDLQVSLARLRANLGL